MSITTSPTIGVISAALLKFQGAVEGVGRNAENSAFKKDGKALKYASLESVIDTARPDLQKVGIVFLQSAGAIVEGVMAMTTRLIHAESGEWIEGTMDIALGKRDPQGTGSAQTYAQRYHLMAMLGLPPVDDDGEGAIDRNHSRPTPGVERISSMRAKEILNFENMLKEIDTAPTVKVLENWREFYAKADVWMPGGWVPKLNDRINERLEELAKTPDHVVAAHESLDRQFAETMRSDG
jgi:hypothetical protein